jgi:glycerol-3-phosphate cytidylyltransferase-like family protein
MSGSTGVAGGGDTVRCLCNGVWDMAHVGHYNAWLQAKLTTGDSPDQQVSIVVALHDGEDVTRVKANTPVFDDDERRYVVCCVLARA